MYVPPTTVSSITNFGVEPVVRLSAVKVSVYTTPFSLVRVSVMGFCSSVPAKLFTASIERVIFASIPELPVALAFAVTDLYSSDTVGVYEEPGEPLCVAMPTKVSARSTVSVTLSSADCPPSKVTINISTVPSSSSIGLVAHAKPGMSFFVAAISLLEIFVFTALSAP